MPQRETRLKPVTLLQVGGVNQRVKSTELPLHEYVTLNGVWPEFAGLQSRFWGKRVLAKYPDAIYGIYQFWTPMGYGGGIYQFDGKIDFGSWITPNSNFDLTVPPLEFDSGGMTFDEFGNPYGSNFGYGTDNACVISFLNGSTDHSACLEPPVSLGTPDDSNGGPGGQGKKCKYVDTYTDFDVEDFILIKEQGSAGYSNTVVTENVGRTEFGCAVTPPLPPQLGPDVGFPPNVYFPISPSGSIGSQQKLAASWAFVPFHSIPACDGQVSVQQRSESPTFNHIVTFNFAALQSFNAYRVTMLASHPQGSQEIVIATDAINSGDDVTVDMQDHRQQGTETYPTFGETTRLDYVTVSQLRVYYRQRVCT